MRIPRNVLESTLSTSRWYVLPCSEFSHLVCHLDSGVFLMDFLNGGWLSAFWFIHCLCSSFFCLCISNFIPTIPGMEYLYRYLYSYLLEYCFFSVLSCTQYLAKIMSTSTRTYSSTEAKRTVLMSTFRVLLSTLFWNCFIAGKFTLKCPNI